MVVVYSDLRILWLANPMTELRGVGGDVAVALGRGGGNSGFWMMEGNEASMAFLTLWMDHLELRSGRGWEEGHVNWVSFYFVFSQLGFFF